MNTRNTRAGIKNAAGLTAARNNKLHSLSYRKPAQLSNRKVFIGELLLFGDKRRKEFWQVFELLLTTQYAQNLTEYASEPPESKKSHQRQSKQGMEQENRKSYWIYETTVRQNDRLILSKTMLRSKAFIRLTGAAKQILLELYMRLILESYKPRKQNRNSTRFYTRNNGKLVLTYKSIHKQFGYSTATISKALDRLVANGFIEIAELGIGVKRQSHKIALITNWQKYGTDEFKPGLGKSNRPVNIGFKKRKNLKITSETKAVQSEQ